MLGKAFAIAAVLAASFGPQDACAQDADARASPTAEEMIAVEREAWVSPSLRPRCPEAQPGEIVVCKENQEEQPRLESPTDEAIRTGQPMPDGLPRAPNVFGLRPCKAYAFCSRIGRAPEPALMIDLAALPYPLTPEEAAHVFRAEGLPPETATPEAASPEAAP